MIVGQKIICVNDTFPEFIMEFYDQLPKKDQVYVIRQVSMGVNFKAELGEVCLLLVGIHNPKSDKPPFPERGFNSERFRPLEEVQGRKTESEPAVVWASPEKTYEKVY